MSGPATPSTIEVLTDYLLPFLPKHISVECGAVEVRGDLHAFLDALQQRTEQLTVQPDPPLLLKRHQFLL